MSIFSKSVFTWLSIFFIGQLGAQERWIQPTDVYRLTNIGAPKLSPEGDWVLYSVSKVDSVKDKFSAKLYMSATTNGEEVLLTAQTKGAANYNWSPDGKYISYLAQGKNQEEGSQLFLMDRRGGEPIQVSEIKAEIENYQWLPNAKKIVFQIKDFNYADTAKSKVRTPYEIDRYHFKADYEGYLDNRHTHLYIFDLATKKLDTLTKGKYNETDPAISYDGNWIAYSSNVSANPDQNSNTDIFLLSLTPGALPMQLTNYKGFDGNPQFSYDNKYLAFTKSSSEDPYDMYDLKQLAIIDLASKSEKLIGVGIDRSVENIQWSADSKNIYALVEDDRKQNIVSFSIANNSFEQITNQLGVYNNLQVNAKGKQVVLFSSPNEPFEIYHHVNGSFIQLTHLQKSFTVPLKKMFVTGVSAIASDKNKVNGILYVTDTTARKLPLVLFIHGGPVAQDEYSFDLSRQIYAAAGYAVVGVNYRGSSGRGANYTKTIYGDWGNKEVKDIIAIANELVKQGIVDESRMAIAGWSYGGILTNYTIATDHRFKAAVSGAGSSLMLSFYGTDQYISQYEPELGKPWENIKKWLDVSYPFFKVNQIKTPTLFMASQNDFNVPVVGAEQMYQAFKSVGIPTQLIIYPNQNHGIRVPSYLVHRYNSHLNWFKTYLK
jgi:dipeptidyl aminopeptidase/acylaminoacyl peptidase